EVLPGLVDPDKWLLNVDEVLAGVKEILAEMISDSADVRGPLRNFIWDVGLIASNKIETLPEGKGKEFEPYANFKEPVREIPPLRGKKVLAIDPGIRTGCKLAVLDEAGKLLEDAVIYPHGQRKNAPDAKRKLEQLVRKHQLSIVAIGNGTGCRETEQLVADLIGDLENRRLNPTVRVHSVPPPAPVAEAPAIAAPDAI